MSEVTRGDFPLLVDLTGVALDRVAQLCQEAASALEPEDAEDYPAIQRALRRVQDEAGRAGEAFVGHSDNSS
jgi:hypothetical protein